MSSVLFRTLTAAVGLTVVVPAIVSGTAHAATGPTEYSCTAPVVGATKTTVEYDSDLPTKMYIGDAARPVSITSKGIIPASTMDTAYNLFSARFVQGTTTLPFTFNAITKTYSATSAKVPIVRGVDTVLQGTTANAFQVDTPAAVGSYKLTLAKSYTSKNLLLRADGVSTAYDPGASTCTRADDPVVDTVEVWAKAAGTLALSASSVEVGTTATATATITSPGATPAGKVTFTVDGQSIEATVGADGKATATFTAKTVGTQPVSATYVPSGTMVEAAAITPVNLTVTPATTVAADTTTTLTLTPTSIETGQKASAKVKVAAGAGTPTGEVTVTWTENGAARSATLTLVSGEATTDISPAAAGTYSITARYAGSTAFKPSSGTGPLVVKDPTSVAESTTTTVVLDPATVTEGKGSTATITVTGARTTPVGTVQVKVNGATLTGTLTNGAARVALPTTLTTGSYQVTATYVPASAAFAPSTSATATYTVTAAAAVGTSTTVTLDRTSISAGEKATATVSVSSPQGAPSGTVQISVNGKLSTAALSGGKASIELSGLPVGTWSISATYVPAGTTWLGSTSTAVALTVNPVVIPPTGTPTKVQVFTSGAVPARWFMAVGAVVSTSSTTRVNGRLTITLDGTTTVLPVRHGLALGFIGTPRQAGTYAMKVTFTPSDASLAPSTRTVEVRVTRGFFRW